MKKLVIIGAVAVAAVVSMSFVKPVSPKEATSSSIEWTGKKVGGQHTGNIKFQKTDLIFKGGKLVSGTFTVDMNSMTCSDLKGEYHDKLIGHLKSDDFFSVAKFPTATFKSNSVKELGANKYTVTGDLTIKGKTNPLTFEAMTETKGKNIVSTAKVVVDRSKFDVKYGSGSFFEGLGDNLIYDDFELAISIETAL